MKKPYVVGIDIGGTNTVFGIVDARGNVLATNSIKTQKHPLIEDYIQELYEGLSKLIDDNDATDKIKGIGIGAPNANYYTGTIEHAPNLPWKGIIPFAEMVSDKFGVPVSITNDANLIYGHDGNAGELGHITIRRGNSRVCGCGLTGCLETFASATGVARSAREFLESRKDEESLLRNIPLEEITSKDVYDAAMAGDKIAQDVFAFTGEILGEAFADFIKITSPEAIILFGGLAKAGDLLFTPTKEAMERNLMPIFRGKVKILLSELKDADAAVLGASALAWEFKDEE